MCCRIALVLFGLAIGSGFAGTTAVAHPGRPCPCVHPDGTAQQGETVCLDINGQRQLARCEMVLNNASWHFLGTPCETVALAGRRSGARPS